MIAALRAAETKTERSGGAGRKGGVGEMNSRPALAFAVAEFRANKVGAPLSSSNILLPSKTLSKVWKGRFSHLLPHFISKSI